MSDLLFELDEFEETRQSWIPLCKPFGITLASIVVGDRCRDCGTRAPSTTQGSADKIGIYMVCDECAQLDGCTTRVSRRGPEWHVSQWGDSHRVEEHDALVAAQERRRGAYRRRVSKAVAA